MKILNNESAEKAKEKEEGEFHLPPIFGHKQKIIDKPFDILSGLYSESQNGDLAQNKDENKEFEEENFQNEWK